MPLSPPSVIAAPSESGHYMLMQGPPAKKGRQLEILHVSHEPATVRVAIVEDLLAIRHGLEVLINGTSRATEEALERIAEVNPHVVLVDIELPRMSTAYARSWKVEPR